MAQEHGDRLTAVDASFIAQEGPNAHMHVGAVMIFDGPPPAYEDLADHVRSRLHLVPRFRQKLAFPPVETGRPLWVDDPSFNLEYHVRDTALPAPGSEAQLRALAARVHSQALDRSKPLWEMWLVHGLEGDRFALISKTHHALVDGVSGVDLATVLFDLTPVPAAVDHPEAPWRPRGTPSGLDMAARGVRGLIALPFEAASRVLDAVTHPGDALHGTREALEGLGEVVWAGLNPAPDTPLNVEIGPHRRLVWVRHELSRLQAGQGRARRHRQRRRARDGRGRAAEVAALARGADRGARAARAGAGLDPRARRAPPARQPDRRDARPAARLRRGPGRAAAGRAPRDGRAEGLQAGARRRGAGRHAGARAADDLRPGVAAELLHPPVQPARHQRARPAVPALRARARAAGPVPGRVPAAKHALAVAIMSYDGGMDFGLLGDYDAMPDLERLGEMLSESLAELVDAAEQAANGAPRTNGKSNAVSSRARTSRPRTSSPATTEA